MNEIISVSINIIGTAIIFVAYFWLLSKIFSDDKFEIIFALSIRFATKYDKLSVTLIMLETVLTVINIPLLIITKWKYRL